MSILKAVLAVSVISASSLVMAEGGGDRVYGRMIQDNEKAMQEYAVSRGKNPPEVTHYRYGMKLDIAKVVHKTSTGSSCEVMPAQMTYEDSNGNLQILEYRVMGTACRNGN
ncbi:DUF2790 domain-containing protein [Pseudomonas rhizophila]